MTASDIDHFAAPGTVDFGREYGLHPPPEARMWPRGADGAPVPTLVLPLPYADLAQAAPLPSAWRNVDAVELSADVLGSRAPGTRPGAAGATAFLVPSADHLHTARPTRAEALMEPGMGASGVGGGRGLGSRSRLFADLRGANKLGVRLVGAAHLPSDAPLTEAPSPPPCASAR